MDHELEAAILAELRRRPAGARLSPYEAVKLVSGHRDRNQRTRLSSLARHAARRLCNRRIVEILQNGRPVDPSHARGSFRIRLRSAG